MKNLHIEILGEVADSKKMAKLLEEVYGKIPFHWKRLFPTFDVVIIGQTFDEIPVLKKAVADANRVHKKMGIPVSIADSWKTCQALLDERNRKKKIYVRLQSLINYVGNGREYIFQRDFLDALAGLLMMHSDNLGEVAMQNATGMASRSVILALTAFRSSFKRFFINPEWLKNRRDGEAYEFMIRIDRIAREGGISKAV